MALHKISDFDTNYRNTIQGNDVKGMSVYTQGTDDKIGTVSDVLVDDQGQFRYLIVDVGFWIFGKKVLLPLGRSKIDSSQDRVYTALMKQQAEDLPEYKEGTVVDYDYEEEVRGVYRPTGSSTASAPVGGAATYDRNTYNYTQDSDLYDTNTHEDQTFKLYEERLVANKQRHKTGEVAIGKHVETETARVAVPVEKERVVVERVTPSDAGKVVPDATAFRSGEVAHVEVYEEVPDIRKETFVKEEVRVKKVVDQETVETQETVRREELDVDSEGRPIVNKKERA
ncbi:PRC-barrel domain-containing protein AvaK [Calothrix sp. NIES-4071]|nr:PRC-barrel domain-containing protein AvaK [Calothrix sp. NIES-4071]BAZ60270.1 PRC-barrel domain-containing protein AvaK [Calothrix sp. NIES-4105]